MITSVALAFSFGVGTECPTVQARPEPRLVWHPTAGSETPLPLNFAVTGLHQTPTQSVLPSRAISSQLNGVSRTLDVAGVLPISETAQAMVDELLAANRRVPTTKRLLSRRAPR